MSLRLAILFLSVLTALLPARGQVPAGARITDFQAPSTDNAGRRSMIKGANAEPAGNGILKITAPHVDNFRADGALHNTIEAAECLFDYNGSKDVWSAKELSMKTADGQLSLQGVGFRFTAANSQLTVSNQVQAVVRPGTNSNTIRITADSLQYQADSIIFFGRVHVVDSEGEVRCQTLKVRLDEKNQIREIEALDDVVLTQKETEARGRRALYLPNSGLLRLFEKTRWRMGDREGESEALILDRARNTLRAENSVKITMPSSLLATNAASGDKKIVITAEIFDFAQTNITTHGPIAIFNGAVHAVDPQATLDCELLTIFFDLTNRLVRAVADRNVKISREDGAIYGGRAIFEKEEIAVQGEPTWRLDQKRGSADLLIFNPRTREVRALNHVHMEFPSGSAANLVPGVKPTSTTNIIIVTAAYFTNLNNVATFSENVRVIEERGQIDADTLTLYFNSTNQVERVIAEGNVILTQEKMQALGQRAEYMAGSDQLRLTGTPKVMSVDRVIIAREFLVDRQKNTFQPIAPFRIEVRRKNSPQASVPLR